MLDFYGCAHSGIFVTLKDSSGIFAILILSSGIFVIFPLIIEHSLRKRRLTHLLFSSGSRNSIYQIGHQSLIFVPFDMSLCIFVGEARSSFPRNPKAGILLQFGWTLPCSWSTANLKYLGLSKVLEKSFPKLELSKIRNRTQ